MHYFGITRFVLLVFLIKHLLRLVKLLRSIIVFLLLVQGVA